MRVDVVLQSATQRGVITRRRLLMAMARRKGQWQSDNLSLSLRQGWGFRSAVGGEKM
jgi:hypothetical protein